VAETEGGREKGRRKKKKPKKMMMIEVKKVAKE